MSSAERKGSLTRFLRIVIGIIFLKFAFNIVSVGPYLVNMNTKQVRVGGNGVVIGNYQISSNIEGYENENQIRIFRLLEWKYGCNKFCKYHRVILFKTSLLDDKKLVSFCANTGMSGSHPKNSLYKQKVHELIFYKM